MLFSASLGFLPFILSRKNPAENRYFLPIAQKLPWTAEAERTYNASVYKRKIDGILGGDV